MPCKIQVLQLNIKSGTDHTTLVRTACEINNNFPSSVIVNDLKFTNRSKWGIVINLKKHLPTLSEKFWSWSESLN
ncbi:unnamed protein product [Caretta caretta]